MALLYAPVPDGRSPAGSILAVLEDAAAIVDGSARVSGWNAAAAARFGLSAQDVEGRPLAELGLPEPADPAALIRLPLGEDAGGGALIVWRRARESLPPEALQLQKAQALGRLAGPVAHDLAQPLGAIISLASCLGSDPGVPEDLRDSAALLRGEADRALRTIRSLLEIVRTRVPEPRPIALGPLVRGILELEAGMLISAETHVAVPDALPDVFADPTRLRQVVLALTMNAIGAMGDDRAHGWLRVTARLREDPARTVRLVVEDSGPVIPEAERAGLFTAFPGSWDRVGRPALDLSVAARLVALDRGRLWYEALPDGNRFVVELLPASRAADAAILDIAVPEIPSTGSVDTPPAESRVPPALTVLVCDDEASIRALVVRVLERDGIRALEAASGEEALGIVGDSAVTAVLADLQMAEMSGAELYRRVIRLRPDLAASFLLMSGDADDAELRAFAAGAGLRILSKPFELAVLPAAVRAAAGA